MSVNSGKLTFENGTSLWVDNIHIFELEGKQLVGCVGEDNSLYLIDSEAEKKTIYILTSHSIKLLSVGFRDLQIIDRGNLCLKPFVFNNDYPKATPDKTIV